MATGGPPPLRTTPSGHGSPPYGPASTPASDDGYRPVGMKGLRLRPPDGWRILEDPATGSVFLSTQTLVLPQGGCAHALDGFCTPLARVLAAPAVRRPGSSGFPGWAVAAALATLVLLVGAVAVWLARRRRARGRPVTVV